MLKKKKKKSSIDCAFHCIGITPIFFVPSDSLNANLIVFSDKPGLLHAAIDIPFL